LIRKTVDPENKGRMGRIQKIKAVDPENSIKAG